MGIKIALKERQRYIFFRIIKESKTNFSQKTILKSIWQSIWRYFGMKEANKIGLWLTELNSDEDYGIIRCSHQTKEIIISALSLVREIDGTKVVLSPIKTSGTIRSLKKAI
ncbi:MAG: Rpp14/Pop5 family protein [Promethearchaeota archaeon]|nr:MAG: Rpp14/Pop5 family protein [Candidatus Lokiarchaeota archaeon]